MKRLIQYCGILLVAAASTLASAQWNPIKPIKIIIPYAPGGSGDIGLRIISDKLSVAMGQPVVMEYKAGAGGVIGTEVGARAPNDGYSWILGSDAPFTIIPHMRKVPYDPLVDLEPASLIASLPMVLVVNSNLPAKNMNELVALSRTRKLTLGSNGNGSSGHIASELLKRDAKVDILHVPYTAQAQVVTDVIGGQLDMLVSSVGPVLQHIKTGRLRPIALTMPVHLDSLPGVPTMAEAGYPGINIGVWIGLLVPTKTPKEVSARIAAEMTKVLAQPDVREKFAALGYVPGGGAPSVLGERIEGDYARWGKVIREAGIKE